MTISPPTRGNIDFQCARVFNFDLLSLGGVETKRGPFLFYMRALSSREPIFYTSNVTIQSLPTARSLPTQRGTDSVSPRAWTYSVLAQAAATVCAYVLSFQSYSALQFEHSPRTQARQRQQLVDNWTTWTQSTDCARMSPSPCLSSAIMFRTRAYCRSSVCLACDTSASTPMPRLSIKYDPRSYCAKRRSNTGADVPTLSRTWVSTERVPIARWSVLAIL